MAHSVKETVLASIERGSVFYYLDNIPNRDGSSSKKPRHFIVLNNTPKTDDFIILATITSQIANRLRFAKKIGEDSSTVVPISPADFPNLTVESAVSCHRVYPITLANLIKKIEGGGTMFSEKIPKPIMGAIISGVMKSGQIEGEYKAMLL